MIRRLHHPCDANSIRSDKYVEHGTAIIKLVPTTIRKVLLRLAKESESDGSS